MSSFYEQVENGILSWEIDLSRFTMGEIRRIQIILRELRDDILDQLRRIAPQDAVRRDTQIRRLERLLDAVNNTINSSYDIIRTGNLDFNINVASLGRQAVGTTINTALEAPLFDIIINDRLMREIVANTIIENQTTRQWWNSQERNYVAELNRELRTGIIQGETIGQLTTRVRDIANTSFNQATSLARTAAITVNNNSVLGMYQDNEDIVRGVQWLSTLDSRTTLICRGLSDKKWRFPENGNSQEYARYRAVGHNKRFPGPTAHWQCRSTQIPWMQALGALSGEIRQDLSGTARAAFGSPVPIGTTQDQWLRRLPVAEQKEILGPTRYRLFRQGVPLTDLTNQYNRPLSIAELESKYSV